MDDLIHSKTDCIMQQTPFGHGDNPVQPLITLASGLKMKLGHEIAIPILGIPAFREVLVNAVVGDHHPVIGNIDVCSVMGFKHQPDIQTTGSFGSGQKPGPSAREDGPPEALSVETSARDVTEETSPNEPRPIGTGWFSFAWIVISGSNFMAISNDGFGWG